jgi:hypothetical protein
MCLWNCILSHKVLKEVAPHPCTTGCDVSNWWIPAVTCLQEWFLYIEECFLWGLSFVCVELLPFSRLHREKMWESCQPEVFWDNPVSKKFGASHPVVHVCWGWLLSAPYVAGCSFIRTEVCMCNIWSPSVHKYYYCWKSRASSDRITLYVYAAEHVFHWLKNYYISKI